MAGRHRLGQGQVARPISDDAGDEGVQGAADRQTADGLRIQFVTSGAQQPEFEVCVVCHAHQKHEIVGR